MLLRFLLNFNQFIDLSMYRFFHLFYNGFNITKHETLFNLIKSQKNVKFCMSNANVKLVSDSFSSYNIKSLQCKRSINSKKPQSTTTELIITNYI
jgi:DNA adenine methylase